MVNFEAVKEKCPYCTPKKVAVLLHNATHDPEDWVEIVDIDSGHPFVDVLKRAMGMDPKDISQKGYLPTGIIKGTLQNFLRSEKHFYWFLRELFKK